MNELNKPIIKFGETRINSIARKHIQECLDNNWVTMGPKTKLFESWWTKQFNVKNAIAVSSGTDALIVALMSLYDIGAKRGDDIIIPALSFIATLNAVLAAGFNPVLVDVRKEDMLINEEQIEAKITNKTRAIVPVTLMGLVPNMPKIKELAEQYSLSVIVDNAEGHLCEYGGLNMEAWADIATYSCYIAHIISASELGVVATNKPHFARAAESIRSHGRKNGELWFDHIRYGLNCKPTDLDCSLGLGALEDAEWTFNTRKANYYEMYSMLQEYNNVLYLTTEAQNTKSSPHGFSIVPKNPKKTSELYKAFYDANISFKRNFGAFHTHQAFSWLAKDGDFPNAEYVGSAGIHFGLHAYLTHSDKLRIVETIKKVFNQ